MGVDLWMTLVAFLRSHRPTSNSYIACLPLQIRPRCLSEQAYPAAHPGFAVRHNAGRVSVYVALEDNRPSVCICSCHLCDIFVDGADLRYLFFAAEPAFLEACARIHAPISLWLYFTEYVPFRSFACD